MNHIAFICCILICCSCKKDGPAEPASSDHFTVTVSNGYGGGTYEVGDTVHIFSDAYSANQLFDQWSGDVSLLDAPYEWHTWFIMPNRAVSLAWHLKNMTPFTLQYRQIMGRDRMKPVYYYFPANTKGIVYLLHGTDGNASVLVAEYEWQQVIKALVYDGYGVVVTECEESTMHTDANGDGKLRWALLPVDTVANVDYANIGTITRDFYSRALLSPSLPRYAIGMSDGGFFASALSYVYHFGAAICYCAQGSDYVVQHTTVPLQFCMARFDSNPQVGAQGNADAQANREALTGRGVCSRFLIKERCPVYPGRFARDGSITASLSEAVFNEMKAKGFLDNKNYFIGSAGDFITACQNDPAGFPVFNSLSAKQQQFVKAQISLSVSDHRMYSDYNHALLQFLNNPCY